MTLFLILVTLHGTVERPMPNMETCKAMIEQTKWDEVVSARCIYLKTPPSYKIY